VGLQTYELHPECLAENPYISGCISHQATGTSVFYLKKKLQHKFLQCLKFIKDSLHISTYVDHLRVVQHLKRYVVNYCSPLSC
jgi:hypothetical protein